MKSQEAGRRFNVLQQWQCGNTANTSQPGPRVFFGKVGSADTVIKSGEHRDKLAQQHGLVGFEMEGAGVWDAIPCIVVKAVCDYADSHKNKEWQAFVAVVAASATKVLLGKWAVATAQRWCKYLPNVPDIDNIEASGTFH